MFGRMAKGKRSSRDYGFGLCRFENTPDESSCDVKDRTDKYGYGFRCRKGYNYGSADNRTTTTAQDEAAFLKEKLNALDDTRKRIQDKLSAIEEKS
ncbi:hypothetical protein MCHI_000890 [Candidatus Magnetoovum chiemensis]|nr:hypothetical protein MCHI_000890 [Candidatus Magnetoovum chiemensis]